MGFSNGLDIGYERKRKVKNDSRISGLQLKGWSCHFLRWGRLQARRVWKEWSGIQFQTDQIWDAYETSKWHCQVGSVLKSLEFGRAVGIGDFYLGSTGIRQSKDWMRSWRKWMETEMKRRPVLCRTSIFESKILLRMILVVLLVNWRIAKVCMTLRIFAIAPLSLPPRASPLVGKCYANFSVVIKSNLPVFLILVAMEVKDVADQLTWVVDTTSLVWRFLGLDWPSSGSQQEARMQTILER